jgi:hypothetical protein
MRMILLMVYDHNLSKNNIDDLLNSLMKNRIMVT